MTKQDLLEENEDLREALREMRERISELLDEDPADADDAEGEE